MFHFDRFIFIGPAASLVEQAIEAVEGSGDRVGGSTIHYTVSATRITPEDIADFTLLASQHQGKVVLTIQNESLRVDTTNADGQATVILDDGQPVGRLGIANEELEAMQPTSPLKAVMESIAQQYGVEIKETSTDKKLVMESLHVLEDSKTVGVVKEYEDGSLIVRNTNANGVVDNLYYVQAEAPSDSNVSVIDDITALRLSDDIRVTAVLNNASDTPDVIDSLAQAFSELPNAEAYLVSQTKAEQSLGLSQERINSRWHISVPAIARFKRG